LPALELRLNLAEDTALNLQEKSAASCGSTECAGSAIFAADSLIEMNLKILF
jgi:hypothetical protein